VAADLRKVHSHGVNRLEMYVQEIQDKIVDGKSDPVIISETPAIANVDGKNGLGFVIGEFCMKLAIKKAKEIGIGWVSAHNSNHNGMAAFYSMMASHKGLIGFSATNTSPLVVPTRATIAALGTNPLSVAAKAGNDSFVLDMATSTVPIGKVELSQRKKTRIPNGWGVDIRGIPTQDPDAVLNGGGLMPLGGEEQNSGYKGYGLALMVELFCGILAGANFGPNIAPWRQGRTGPANLGQCYFALDPEKFAHGFENRLSMLLKQLRDLPAVETIGEIKSVLIPGDPEKIATEKQEKEGIELHPNLIEALLQLAKKLNVKAPTFFFVKQNAFI